MTELSAECDAILEADASATDANLLCLRSVQLLVAGSKSRYAIAVAEAEAKTLELRKEWDYAKLTAEIAWEEKAAFAYFAGNGTPPFLFNVSAVEPVPVDFKEPRFTHFSAEPRLIVRDVDGIPMVGRYCRITTKPQAATAFIKLELDYTCGPSGSDGIIRIEDLRVVEGGATGELEFVVEVDGVQAELSNSSYWLGGSTITFISADEFSLHSLSLLVLQGHESIVFFAVIALPIFGLNSVGWRNEPPSLHYRVAGTTAFAYLAYIVGAVCTRAFLGPPGTDWGEMNSPNLVTFGMADMTALRPGSVSLTNLPLALTLAMVIWLAVLITCLSARTAMIESRSSRRAIAKLSEMSKAAHESLEKATGIDLDGDGDVAGDVKPIDVKPPLRHGNTSVWGQQPSVQMLKAGTVASVAVLSPRERIRAWWQRTSELAAHRRMRLARGHVSRLLAGRVWQHEQVAMLLRPPKSYMKPYLGSSRFRCLRAIGRMLPTPQPRLKLGTPAAQRLPYRQKSSFIYPQRLWFAAVLSSAIQLMLTLVFVNVISWLGAVMRGSEQLAVQIAQESEHHVDFSPLFRYSNTFRAMMVIVFFVTTKLKSTQYIIITLDLVGVVLPIFQYTVLVLNWFAIFKTYKARVLDMRHGEYFFDRANFREEHANRFVGFQVAGLTITSFIFYFIGFVLVITAVVVVALVMELSKAANEGGPETQAEFRVQTTQALRDVVGGLTPIIIILLTTGISLIFQMCMNRYVFFVGPKNNKWLRYRFFYGLYDYNMYACRDRTMSKCCQLPPLLPIS